MVRSRGNGQHLATVAMGYGADRASWRYFAWCETCARGSRMFDHAIARDLVALHLIDPERSPVHSSLDAEAIRARADDELGAPYPWL